ncbi:hypothetical protein THTE_1922 [Thermogutta terrifontis]|uniref:Uncharacterized protein n=1 Tax=Thermogutta terrifontis TaxID=1331910 RepID=A0A286REZ1_9BACT|nr:hypothetical protein THTE_1922 [Thermogutta terrifontis]
MDRGAASPERPFSLSSRHLPVGMISVFLNAGFRLVIAE